MKPFSPANSNDYSEERTHRKIQPKFRASTPNTQSVYFTNVEPQLMRPHSITTFMVEKGTNLLFLCLPWCCIYLLISTNLMH